MFQKWLFCICPCFYQVKQILMRTTQSNKFTLKGEEFIKQALLSVIHFILSILLLIPQLFLIPLLYLINSFFKMMAWMAKILQLMVSIPWTGIQGVRKKIIRHYYAQEIHYAILKGNGQYLKLKQQSLQATMVCQLYDYTFRKFMTIGNIDEDLRVCEIQFSAVKGLQFLRHKLGIKNVFALSNKPKKIRVLQDSIPQINFKFTNYIQKDLQPFDVFILFNSIKDSNQYGNYIDLIRVFTFIKQHLNQGGYAIFGRYFDSEGENTVFEELFEAFGFKIQAQEDITPNIKHAEKMLLKIHKDRMIAWSFFHIKQMISRMLEKDNLISKIFKGVWTGVKKFARKINNEPRYIVYILEKK